MDVREVLDQMNHKQSLLKHFSPPC